MKRTTLAALLAVGILLTGCSAGAEDDSSAAPNQASETPAPLVAEEPEAAEDSTPEAEFLVMIRDMLPEDTSIPNATDEQLVAAGEAACGQMAEGIDFSAVSVIEGEPYNEGMEMYDDSALIASAAMHTLCPN